MDHYTFFQQLRLRKLRDTTANVDELLQLREVHLGDLLAARCADVVVPPDFQLLQLRELRDLLDTTLRRCCCTRFQTSAAA